MGAIDRGRAIVVAGRGERVLGFSGPYSIHGSGKGAFWALGVDPGERRQGLGTALFDTMCAKLKAEGARFVTLTTGLANPAQEIYRRAGFRTGCVVDAGLKKELTP